MDLDISAFRAAFPAFADDAAYPDAMLDGKMIVAKCYVEDNQCTFDDTCRQYAYQLMVAHLLSIGISVAAGQPGRLIASAGEGPVNVSFSEPPTSSNFSYWLMTTPYGVELAALLSANSVGDYYGGSVGLSAFKTY
jgi:hypothetical protein